MVLFDPIVEVFAVSNTDWLQSSPRLILQPVLGVTAHERFPVV
jgi:hypothetical protein